MKTILFLTNSFPFLPGEQFIEAEIAYWENQREMKVIVVPTSGHGPPRSTSLIIDTTCIRARTLPNKLRAVLEAVASRQLWREVGSLGIAALNFNCALRAFRSTAALFFFEAALLEICTRHGRIDVVYSYWNDVPSFGAVLLKRRGYIGKVVTRVHRYDLYAELRPRGYMPLRDHFINQFDLIFPISDQARSYLERRFGETTLSLTLSRLGVTRPAKLTPPTSPGSLHILSVAFLTEVKRVDRIILAIKLLAAARQELNIRWTHIGGGPLGPALESMANDHLQYSNVSFSFAGTLSSKEIYTFYATNTIDVFVNASASEGVPVAIMEAMSHGIPAIAPDVGGIRELVYAPSGILLDDASPQQLAAALEDFSSICKSDQARKVARQIVLEKFDSDRNYTNLVGAIAAIAK